MTDALVSAKIPYTVDYHVPRGRRLRANQVWEDIPLSLRAPTDAEAPIAYRIARIGPKNDAAADFEIRTFDGQLWWPVLDNGNGRRAAKGFLDGLAAGECYPLEVLQLRNVPLRSSSKLTFGEWLSRMSVREVVRTSRDAQVAWAQRGASETMICDDVVYVAAGKPMYFGFPSELPGGGGFSLSVGATPWAAFIGFTNRIPGLHRDDRRSALFAANVFDVRTLDKDIARLEGEGSSVRFDGKVETLGDPTGAGNALHMCANAALCRLLREQPIAAAFLERIPGGAKPRVATDLIPLDVCREVLRDIVELYPPHDQGCILKDAILCAQSVLRRLALSLAQEDEEALGSLAR
jgi:hypothetical protein